MPSSQEFREALQAGKIQEAFTLALAEAVELKITTWVSSSDFDADAPPREATSTIASRGSVDEAKPGHRLRTNINLMQGDIEHEIGDRFLQNNAYRELLQFHFTQVDKGQQIIEQNIHSLQKIFSLVTSLKTSPSDSTPAAIALEEAETEPLAEIESTTEEHRFSENSFDAETSETAAEPFSDGVLDNLALADEEFQQARSDLAPADTELSETEAEALPPLFAEEESSATISLSEEASDRENENLDISDHWLEEETSPSPANVDDTPSDSPPESFFEAEETARDLQDIQDSEAADNQTEAFIDTLFSSDDWIEEELPELSSSTPGIEHSDISTPAEQLEIEGWDRSSNLHLSEPIVPSTEEIPETSEPDIFQIENLDALSESEEELDLEDWEFSSGEMESDDFQDREVTSDLQSLEIEELTPMATSEVNLNALASELTSESQFESEEDAASFAEIDNPWDVSEPERSSLEALSLDEDDRELENNTLENNTLENNKVAEEEDEEEDWGDFVKFVEQDLSGTDASPPASQQETDSSSEPDLDPFTIDEESDRDAPLTEPMTERSLEEAIALEESWDTSSELDPFATSQSDSESYTSIVEEDWEEFAIEELEPYPKPEGASWQDPLLEETVATASIDEILDDPPELIDEEIAEFSESELDRAWDEELFGDEFNFDISLSDEADMPSSLLEVEVKPERQHNS
ncbi:MAG: hypothetical protein J7647_06900 [Cyanobacteria bacterium SBLK]|nr:hypothetical protein [Cyanobacteria bacterium SBLK]